MTLEKPYPEWAIPRMLIGYIGRKQVAYRPVTLYNMSKRIGFGIHRLLGLLEENKVTYSLIQHEKVYSSRTTEILLDCVPSDLAIDAGINAEKVSQVYREIMNAPAPDPVDPKLVDPYRDRRLDDRKFEIYRYMLITFQELVTAGKEAGYGVSLIERAAGVAPGFKPVSKVWFPYLYGRRKFYHRQVLEHLQECEKTALRLSQTKSVRKRKKSKREKKIAKLNFLSK